MSQLIGIAYSLLTLIASLATDIFFVLFKVGQRRDLHTILQHLPGSDAIIHTSLFYIYKQLSIYTRSDRNNNPTHNNNIHTKILLLSGLHYKMIWAGKI